MKPFKSIILVYLLLAFVVFSCVPNRKIVYLQHKDELKRSYPTDSVLRTYSLKRELYRLKPEDIISLRVASITDDEFNFISKYEMQLGSMRQLSQYSQGSPSTVDRGLSQGGLNYSYLSTMGSVGTSLMMDAINSGFKIALNGELELPQIGTVQLAGLTISEAEDVIRRSLLGYYETPMVRIQLLNFHYTILGEINSEGRYTSYNPELNIFEAIILAGNLTELADRTQIKIVRQNGENSEIVYLNTLSEDLLNNSHFYIKPNDMIIVPPLQARSTSRYTLPRVASTVGILSSTLSVIALIITLSR
jgi:polysaccharide biosynthesis/export protein